ncbi:MAG: histidine kinase dimerization/phospho-acceptor domain-containing protein [bacterium]
MAALRRLEILGELAASTAHEIRNPVTAIRGFLQLLSPAVWTGRRKCFTSASCRKNYRR